jgi:hypothetical protein
MQNRYFLELRTQIWQLEEAPADELPYLIKTIKRLVNDTERAVQRQVTDLEHEINRLRRFSIMR